MPMGSSFGLSGVGGCDESRLCACTCVFFQTQFKLATFFITDLPLPGTCQEWSCRVKIGLFRL